MWKSAKSLLLSMVFWVFEMLKSILKLPLKNVDGLWKTIIE